MGAVHPRGGRQSPEVSRVPRCGRPPSHHPSQCDRQFCANVLLLFKLHFSYFSSFCSIFRYFSQHQGHIHTKKHLSKMAGACRPSLNRDSEEHEQRPWDDLLFDYTQGRQTSMKKALLTAASGPIATANADVTAAAVMVAEAVKKAAVSTATVAATPPTELASPVTTMALVPARPLAQQMAVVPARQVAVVPARPLAQQVAVVPARRVLLRSRSRPRSRQRRSRTRSRSRRRSPSTSSTPRRRRKRRQRRQRRKSTTSSSSSTSSRCSRRQQHQQRTRRRKNRCSVP